MSHVSSLANSSYPYRGTLSRLDENGDGLLSRQELAAGQRPGLLETDANDENDGTLDGPLSSLMAKLMQLPSSIKPDQAKISLMQPSASTDADLQTAIDAYRGTYGQYEMDNVA
ncbi:hypothetical protein [Rhizobium tubonense]|uniref:EF-hand domain-containing protein n=1 Tax=Rhizobium tubonense TaxID=484088 RepID=A0A2W4EV44_9HYPH|nr:hypothetical protein [Rhizobium tubonense]PZM17006.1 hypothetical protein CPY51_01845 [Rhizobium tubonense]